MEIIYPSNIFLLENALVVIQFMILVMLLFFVQDLSSSKVNSIISTNMNIHSSNIIIHKDNSIIKQFCINFSDYLFVWSFK